MSETQERTAGPWRTDDVDTHLVISPTGFVIASCQHAEGPANAASVVKCCNGYEKAIEALRTISGGCDCGLTADFARAVLSDLGEDENAAK